MGIQAARAVLLASAVVSPIDPTTLEDMCDHVSDIDDAASVPVLLCVPNMRPKDCLVTSGPQTALLSGLG